MDNNLLNAPDINFSRDVSALENEAVKWWPKNISDEQNGQSIIPRLLETQQKFLKLIKSSVDSPLGIFKNLDQTDLSGSLFLKHLAVLADYGGEVMKRVSNDFITTFPFDETKNTFYFDFIWNSSEYRYDFTAMPVRGLNNSKLGIDGKGVLKKGHLTSLQKDAAMIMLFAAAALNEGVADKGAFVKCTIGALLGNAAEVDQFVMQRYILVSRITGGAEANTLGQSAQTWVRDRLIRELSHDYEVRNNGKIQIDGQQITSDILVTRGGVHVGIEISFQVTTNSTIERKGNEAEQRRVLMHREGNYVAYIIDGAGNFERRSAITKICNNSDCTVAFSEPEVDVLISFIEEKLA